MGVLPNRCALFEKMLLFLPFSAFLGNFLPKNGQNDQKSPKNRPKNIFSKKTELGPLGPIETQLLTKN